MLYKITRSIVRSIIWILNGHLHVHNKERLPEGTYILVAPHRIWWEPILSALATSPMTYMFMAKRELFKNPILSFILRRAGTFPADRRNPGPSALTIPVKGLRKDRDSLVIFPSGTCHSVELRSGAFVIAKMSGKSLLPVVYQGPSIFKDFLKWKPLEVAVGDPIAIDRKSKIDQEATPILYKQSEDARAKLDHDRDPSSKHISK